MFSRNFLAPVCCLLVLASCKTKVSSTPKTDPFPPTANLSYTAFDALLAEGVDLYAYSNEAGWKLRIDLGNRAVFTGADGSERVFNFSPGFNQHINLNEPFIFTDGTNNMRVQFTRSACEDREHNYTNPYQAEVSLNEVMYKGCALHVFNKRVNGSWKLISISGTTDDKTVKQSGPVFIDADNGLTRSIFDCDSVNYLTTFGVANVAFEQSFRKTVKKCKVKAPSTLINAIPSFTTYEMEGDSLLVFKDTEERQYLFLRK